MNRYDAGIIGLGTMGSLTALALVKRGRKVIGFDSFGPPHDRGSHSGDTRIFRTAYAEHPNYVPLAVRAGELWDQLSEEFQSPLLSRTGMLTMGEASNSFLAGIRASAHIHRLPIETLSAVQIREHFPALAPSDEFVGILERTAGWIDVNEALQQVLTRARSLGAELEVQTPVSSWEFRKREFQVRTKTDSWRVEKLIVTAGPWAGSILKDLNLPLTVRRKVLAWFRPALPELFLPEALPVFAFAPNLFYGFPEIKHQGVKVSEHAGGRDVADLKKPADDPDETDLGPLIQAARRFLPGLVGYDTTKQPTLLKAKTCFYTMTPDEHFIIDQHPSYQNLWFAAGFSGHGFKFAPVVAQALSELALEGKTSLPVEFLRLKRLSLNTG
jgi:monomeric sarcosine oxidase